MYATHGRTRTEVREGGGEGIKQILENKTTPLRLERVRSRQHVLSYESLLNVTRFTAQLAFSSLFLSLFSSLTLIRGYYSRKSRGKFSLHVLPFNQQVFTRETPLTPLQKSLRPNSWVDNVTTCLLVKPRHLTLQRKLLPYSDSVQSPLIHCDQCRRPEYFKSSKKKKKL